jgi:succinate dehydrogenase / fumarate reductase cytochrome b subunit
MASSWLSISSVAKKVYMAIAGLFLITFLMVHLGINLCLLRNDGGEWFTAAATFMSTNYIVKVFEVFLFLGFILHIILGVILQIQNWMARPQRYKVEGFSHTSFFSKYMIHTGVIIFIFLVIHMTNFYFVKLGFVEIPEGAADKHDFYTMAGLLFGDKSYAIIYVIFMAILGFHLNHAFQSAFQSLGLNHSRYMPAIRLVGHLYSIVVPLGFAVIPIFYMMK